MKLTDIYEHHVEMNLDDYAEFLLEKFREDTSLHEEFCLARADKGYFELLLNEAAEAKSIDRAIDYSKGE